MTTETAPLPAGHNSWIMVVLRAVDIFWATLVWRDYGITISSLTGLQLRRTNPAWWAKALGWVLNHIQPNHCELAIQSDIMRAYNALTILEAPLCPPSTPASSQT